MRRGRVAERSTRSATVRAPRSWARPIRQSRISAVASASGSARWHGLASVTKWRESAARFAGRRPRSRLASATVSTTVAATRRPVSRIVSLSRNARSNRALCATSTASPAKSRKWRTTAPTGGARRSCSSRSPVRAATAGWSRAPGLASVWNRSASSSPRMRTAPTSHGRAVAGPQAGGLEVEHDECRLLEQQRIARDRGQCNEVAAPAEPGIRSDGLVEERPCQPHRNCLLEPEHLSGCVVRRDRTAPLLDQLDEPVGRVQAKLHAADASTNMCSCRAAMRWSFERVAFAERDR